MPEKYGQFIHLDGQVIPSEDAQLSFYSHSFLYGTSAFEGIRVYQKDRHERTVFRLEDHIDRLLLSCKILGFLAPYSKKEIMNYCIDLCKANKFTESFLRPTVFVDRGPLGLSLGTNPPTRLVILNWTWDKYLGDKKSVSLITSPIIRTLPNSLFTRAKISGYYAMNTISKGLAVGQGFDEALLLDHNGFVAEASGQNIFMVKNNVVFTPRTNSILPGITRDAVITYLEQSGISIRCEDITLDQLWCAEEVFLTGTATEIASVGTIDGRKIETGISGKITSHIQEAFLKIFRGQDQRFSSIWSYDF
ncbi:MAG TPA: branched-chain amino acid transaminase [Oligoflexia bacterium]|nr:branched-chain amino acid transaminase [Oligoflexia bacterium]HMR24296.1 branched-chain amino acid transaminase [Oligoflexia bacterium]